MRSDDWRYRLGLLGAVAIALFAGVRLPRADSPHYIEFADTRWNNALNVWSNAAFLIAGIAGLIVLFRNRARLVDAAAETWPLALFFAGNIATSFGSAYFHAHPDLGFRLAWDRIPMTIAFAAFLGVQLNERIRMRLGSRLTLVLLVPLGLATVLWWLYTDPRDLSFYSAFQALAAAGTLFMLLFFPPLYTGDKYYFIGVALYGVAKIFELYTVDHCIFDVISVSGHTLKHLLAAGTSAMIVIHVGKRRP